MENKKRFDNLDLLKFLAIIMVVSQHVPLFYCDYFNDGNIVQYLFKLIFEGVPIFYLVNGFLLFNKEELNIKKHYLKTIKIYVIMRIWMIFLILIGLRVSKTPFNFSLFVDLLFRLGVDDAVYTAHFWFLQDLLAIYIVYPMLYKMFKDNYRVFKIIFVVLLCLSIGAECFDLFANAFSRVGYIKVLRQMSAYYQKFNPFSKADASLCFFMLGGIIVKEKDYFNKKRLIFIILGFVSWLVSFGYAYFISEKNNYLYNEYLNASSIFTIFIVLGFYGLSTFYKNKKIVGSFISSVGHNTFGIYAVHCLIIEILKIFIPLTYFYQRTIITILTFVISYLLCLLFRKIPYLKKLITFS